MKEFIQRALDADLEPSTIQRVTHNFTTYASCMIASPPSEDNSVILMLYNGPQDDLKWCPVNRLYIFDKNKVSSPKFNVLDIFLTDEEAPLVECGKFYDTSEFTLPTFQKPTFADIMILPTLDDTADIDCFMENGLDEFLRCDYRSDICGAKMYKDFAPRIKFEAVIQNTTDYQKYGDIVYRMVIDGAGVGIATRSGRYLETIMLYPTNLEAITKFMEELEAECFEDPHDISTKSHTMAEEACFLHGDVLNAIVAGNVLNNLS